MSKIAMMFYIAQNKKSDDAEASSDWIQTIKSDESEGISPSSSW